MVKSVRKCLALLERSCRHVADEHCCYDSILITYVNAREVSVALFKSELEVLASELVIKLDPLTDELESGKRLLELNSVVIADALYELGRYDRRNGERLIRKCSEFLL